MPGRSNSKKGGGASWLKGALLIVLVAGLVFVFRQPLAVLAFVLTGGSISMTKAVDTRPLGYFYRFTARYSHKGEPLVFDYVVACNIRITSYRGGDRSDDSTYAPKAMMLPTKSGGAVMVRTINACRGETTENGQAPEDLFPMAIWFDDVDDMTFGWGYATWDAYESESSQLEFHEARISAATRADWEAWREASAKDFEPVGMITTPWGVNYAEPSSRRNPNVSSDTAKRILARQCSGYVRLKIPNNIRREFQSFRKNQEHKYWYIEKSITEIFKIMERGEFPNGKEFKNLAPGGTILYAGTSGLPRWGGGGTLYKQFEHTVPYEVYPLLPISRSLDRKLLEPTSRYPRNLLIDSNRTRGFLACGGDAPYDLNPHRFDSEFARKKKPVVVNGVDVVGPHRTWGEPSIFFERDEYMFLIDPAGSGSP